VYWQSPGRSASRRFDLARGSFPPRSTRVSLNASLWSVGQDGSELDEAQIREFLTTEYPRLVGAVALIAGSRALAEDAVQEAVARAWERSERGERIESLGSWVMTVAINLSRSAWRRRRVERRAHERLGERAAAPADPGVSAPELVDLRRAMGELPRRQREVVVLHYYLDLPVATIGAALGVDVGTVKTSLFRARRSLAAALGVADADAVEGEPERA
jgi:RNA polymerase sigma-70 factor (ECF subfamily)